MAILPWRVRSTETRFPLLSTITSSPGDPLESRPHRTMHSSKPFSQPSPPRSPSSTHLGCTGPLTGDSQPTGIPRQDAFQSPIPRVGRMEKESSALVTSTRSTPLLKPPCRRVLETVQSGTPRSSWPRKSDSFQTLAPTSVKTQDFSSAMALPPLYCDPRILMNGSTGMSTDSCRLRLDTRESVRLK